MNIELSRVVCGGVVVLPREHQGPEVPDWWPGAAGGHGAQGRAAAQGRPHLQVPLRPRHRRRGGPHGLGQEGEPQLDRISLTLSLPNKLSARFLVCFNFHSAQCHPQLMKMLSECQTAWIRVRQ